MEPEQQTLSTTETTAPIEAPAPVQTEAKPAEEPHVSLINAETVALPKAPDEYKFSFPEGFEASEQLVGEFTPLAKKLNLTQESAQELIDLYTKSATYVQEANTNAFKQVVDEWATSAKQDQEFGGSKFTENVSVAKEALAKFGNDKFKSLLDDTGLGNHPELLRFMFKVGKMIKEDKIHVGSNPVSQQRDVASIMYPTMV